MNLATAIHLAAGKLHDALNEDDAIRGEKTPFDLCREALTMLDEALLASPSRALSLESVREGALEEAKKVCLELEIFFDNAITDTSDFRLLEGKREGAKRCTEAIAALQHAPARVAEGESDYSRLRRMIEYRIAHMIGTESGSLLLAAQAAHSELSDLLAAFDARGNHEPARLAPQS